MPFSTIDTLPAAPQRTDPPDDFADRADTFVVAMKTFSEQLNTFISELETAAALIAAAPAYADPGLVALTGLTPAADKLAYFTGSGSSALADLTAAARTLLAQSTQAGMRTTGLGMSANGSSLVSAADYAAMKTMLGLVIGTNVQAYDAELAALAGLTSAADKAPYFTGSGTAALMTVSSFIRTLLDDADQAAACTTLGARRVVASSLTANGGWIEYDDGMKETWGYVDCGANGDSSYTVPRTHTSWIIPVGLTRIQEANAGQQENCGISDSWTHTTVGSIALYNAENFTVRLYIRTLGV